MSALPPVIALPTLAPGRCFDVRITPPGSKSLTNRAVLLAALAAGESVVRSPLRGGDDAERMIAAVSALGAGVAQERDGSLRITGVGGRWRVPASGVTLDLGNAGTAVRFLAGAALLSPAPITIDGNERMRRRPIGELAEALEAAGARVSFSKARGFPPLTIHPRDPGAPLPSVISVGAAASGQFVSALLLAGVFIPGGVTLRLREATSASYIAMTLGLLGCLGASIKTSDNLSVIRVFAGDGAGGGMAPFDYTVEPDASGATYFWSAAAVSPESRCAVTGLDEHSLQGDSRFPDVLMRMGATVARTPGEPALVEVRGTPHVRPIFADMSDMPDAAVTLAAVACFARGTSIIRGLRTLRVKESDRIEALRAELGKVGVRVECPVNGDADTITVTPPEHGVDCSPGAPPVTFDTYDDHRMAMALALIGLRRPNTSMNNPACVGKTYPSFWDEWSRLFE